MHLKLLKGEAHRALSVICPASISVLFNDEFLREFEEGVVDVGAILSACLDYRDLRVLLLELLDFLVCHLYVCFIVHFVGVDHDLHVAARVLLDFVEPDRDTEETLTVSQVEDYDDAIGALVVRISDGPIALLPCRVPYLQLDRALIDLEGAEAEVNSDRANVILLETIILS